MMLLATGKGHDMHQDRVSGIARVVCKFIEIGHWIAAGLTALILICSPIYRSMIDSVPGGRGEPDGLLLGSYGFNAQPHGTPAQYDNLTVFLWSLGSTTIMVLVAVAFRSLWKVLCLAQASVRDVDGKATPFLPQSVADVRRIGYCLIAVPLVGYVIAAIAALLKYFGADVGAISLMDPSLLVNGLIALSLSQVFMLGVKLQRETNGLL